MNHTRKPIVGMYEHFIFNDGLMAVTVDPREHGSVAATMALEILRGKTAAQIPMSINNEGYVMVNLKNQRDLVFDPNVEIDQIADVIVR